MIDLRSSVLGAVATAGLVGVVAWLVGVNLAQSGLLATAALTAGAGNALLRHHTAARTRDRWPDRVASASDGIRREVLKLSWSLSGRRGAVTQVAVGRVRILARRRLRRLDIDLDDPRDATRAERALGSAAYGVLTAGPDRPVRYVAYARCVEALEHLDQRLEHGRVGAIRPAPSPQEHPR